MPLATNFHLMTPSVSRMKVDGVARLSFRRLNTPYSCGTPLEGSYRMGKGIPSCDTTLSAPTRLSTLTASTSASDASMSSYTPVSSPS